MYKRQQYYFSQLKSYKRQASERQNYDDEQDFNLYDYEYNDDAYDLPGSRNYRDKMKRKSKAQSTKSNNDKNNSYNNNNNRKKSPFSPQSYKVTKNKKVHTHPLDFPRNPQGNRTGDHSNNSNRNRQDLPSRSKNKKGRTFSNKGQRNGRY